MNSSVNISESWVKFVVQCLDMVLLIIIPYDIKILILLYSRLWCFTIPPYVTEPVIPFLWGKGERLLNLLRFA